MRRLYVCPAEVWNEHLEHFHPTQGSHYIDLGDGMMLVATDFTNEDSQELWENHAAVAPLPHPTFEGTATLKAHVADATKKFSAKHLGYLASIGVMPEDSVLDVSRKARAIHPLVKIGNML